MFTQLGNDILLFICSMLDVPCILKLLSTCKFLWKLRILPSLEARLQLFRSTLQVIQGDMMFDAESFWIKQQYYDAIYIASKVRSQIECVFPDSKAQRRHCLRCYNEHGLTSAARFGNLALVNYFIKELSIYKGADWDAAMREAARGGHRVLVELFIQKGAKNLNLGLSTAAKEGHNDLVELFIQKGADNWNWAMHDSARRGHKDLVELFIQKGADNWNDGMCAAALGGYRDLVELFIQKGADDWKEGMCSAIAFGHRDLVELFIQKGADNWEFFLQNVTTVGRS